MKRTDWYMLIMCLFILIMGNCTSANKPDNNAEFEAIQARIKAKNDSIK